jgi:P-type Ca2+ transporter type 2C
MRNETPNSADMNPADMEPCRQTVDDVLAALGTDRRSGLSQSQAQERLERYGRNELTAEAPVPEWRKFLAQFTDVLVILLIIAASVSAGLWLYERDFALP